MSSTASRLDIYNMALGFIGSRTVGSPNEKCNEAIQCELYWDRARRSALRDYPYNFAMQRVQLAEKPVPDVYCKISSYSNGSVIKEPFTWLHCYGWPDKCLKIFSIHNIDNSDSSSVFHVETNGNENLILTNIADAQADIVFDQDNISTWDEAFVMAMARKLSCLIAVPILKNNQQKLNELLSLYQQAVPVAEGINNSESRRVESLDSWLTARGNGVSYES